MTPMSIRGGSTNATAGDTIVCSAPKEETTLGRPASDVRDLHGMRVALFTDTFAPQLNGVTRTLARLAGALVDRGATLRTVTVRVPDDAHQDVGLETDAEVVRWASAPFWCYPELRLAAPAFARAAALIRDFRPTLVHTATPFGVGLAGRYAARARGIPLVSSYHTHFGAYARAYGLGALESPAWPFLRWFHNGGKQTFVPTRAIATELSARGFRDLSVWGRGVDTVRFHPDHRSDALRARWGARPHDIVVTYVGRLAPEKGLDLALDALRLAQDQFDARAGRDSPRLRVVLVGDGPYMNACRARAPIDTVFTGMLEGAALSAAYASSDLFLFPSRTDTFGNVLLEAMASHLAVLAVDAPSSRELLDEGRRGLVSPARVDALAANLVRLAATSTRRELALHGARFAATQTWERIFDDLFAGYRTAVDAGRGSVCA